ncbi:Zw10, partial [Symbiodinium microadriaticum]
FYNDCCYIAHNATLISHQYRQGICEANPGLQDCVGFVDFIPRFRAMGERSLQVHIEEQKRTLLVLLGKVRIHIDDEDADSAQDIDEFGGSSGISGGEVCNSEEAATLLVKHMGRLKGQWQNVLQESVYERLAGYLLEVVLRRAMRPVLAAKFVSERAATDVSRVFKAVQKGREVLLGGGTDQRMTSLVGSWGKFCALTDLLEYSLSDIAEWLPRRKFAEFTGSEMSLLVKALFEDSHRRQAILASILEMSS